MTIGNNGGIARIIKLFEFDDNKYTTDLKLKVETEKAMMRKHMAEQETFAIQLNGCRNNIAIVRRTLDFLKGSEAKIVIMTEYDTYRKALPKLLKDETDLMNNIEQYTKAIQASEIRIAEMEAEIVKNKTKILPFRSRK